MVSITERFIMLQLQESPDSEMFLRKLIKRGIITYSTMRNYCIVKYYDEYLRCNKGRVTHTLDDLGDDFNLEPRSVRRIHQEFCRKF